MNQHISSMLETLSSLRRKNSESSQSAATTTTTTPTATSLLVTVDDDQKEVSDVESMSSKTKSLFKDLISDNGATNTILQNCTNFIKCTSTISKSHLNASSSSTSSPSNGTCKQQQLKVDNHDGGDDNNNEKQQTPKVMSNLHPTANDIHKSNNNNNSTSSIKNNSIGSNGDLKVLRDLSPTPRNNIACRRKSSYDGRLLRNGNEDDGRHIMRPLKTRNIITKNETFDTLHYRAMDVSIHYFFCL